LTTFGPGQTGKSGQMALTIRQLNGDASLLLTFQPIASDADEQPFRILLDPWLVGPSNILHSKISSTTRRHEACVSSLRELPEPDLVIISNSRSDHCNEATLRQLPPHGTRTLILAEATAAKLIRSWKYFDQDKVLALERWREPRQTGRNTMVRVPVPSRVMGGDEGQVTVSFITQRKDTKGLHSAIGITYRPACSDISAPRRPMTATFTPVSTPCSDSASRMASLVNLHILENLHSPILPPIPPFAPLGQPADRVPSTLRAARSIASLSPHTLDRGVSVIYSPHGIPYRAIEPYATSHLVAEAALPLTALLHCFDAVSQPWWFGGNITSGFHDGQEIVAKLGARAWISTYDGDKQVGGLASRLTRRTKYNADEVRGFVHGARISRAGHTGTLGSRNTGKMDRQTEIMALSVGEEVALTSEGVWEVDTPSPTEPNELSHHLSTRRILYGNDSRESLDFSEHTSSSSRQT
jgi:hypothetical protein